MHYELHNLIINFELHNLKLYSKLHLCIA